MRWYPHCWSMSIILQRMVTGRERQRRHSFHSLAHTTEKRDRKQSGFTSFFWQHLNMHVQSPGQRDMCLCIHPEHTHCSSTSRCQSFQKEIQNLCISWPRSENEEETVRKGKPTNVGSYIRQSILLRHVIYSFSSSHVILQPFKLPKVSVGLKTEVLHTCTPPIHHRWSSWPAGMNLLYCLVAQSCPALLWPHGL